MTLREEPLGNNHSGCVLASYMVPPNTNSLADVIISDFPLHGQPESSVSFPVSGPEQGADLPQQVQADHSKIALIILKPLLLLGHAMSVIYVLPRYVVSHPDAEGTDVGL